MAARFKHIAQFGLKILNGIKTAFVNSANGLKTIATSNRRRIMFSVDLFITIFSYWLMCRAASGLFADLSLPQKYLHCVFMLALIYGCRLLLGIYSNIWRYAGCLEYTKLIVADMIGGLLYWMLQVGSPLRLALGRSVAVASISLLICISIRMAYQTHHLLSRNREYSRFLDEEYINKINVAIVGAGTLGALLSKEMKKTRYHPYCFIDNDPEKIGQYVNGLPVYSEDGDVVSLIKRLPVQEIIIAISSINLHDKKLMIEKYKETGCSVKLYDFQLETENSASEKKRIIRDIRIEDLLFRDSLNLSSNLFDSYTNKTILITGAGGSIGSEICRQLANAKPKKLILLDIYENNVYDIQQELILKYGHKLDIAVEIASVRDLKRIRDIFAQYHPEIVFHAAAHKHVPLMEHNCAEAIKNNVFGTLNMVNVSEEYKVNSFIQISTDKAVNPTNIMGASKRMCELIIQSRKDSLTTKFVAVRFGNVLGSNGSVIPLFKRQIAAGGPVTITDRRIIRYFMTIPEATQLVMQAGAMANRSEIFVLDMGKPVRIIDLAKNLIELSGLKPYEDIDILEIGLRPGEKLYEELLVKTEEMDKTDNHLIFIERAKPVSRIEIEEKLDVLRAALKAEDSIDGIDNKNAIIRQALKDVVPTFHSADEVNILADESDEMLQVKAVKRGSAHESFAPEPSNVSVSL